MTGLLLTLAFQPDIDGKYREIRCKLVKGPWTWNDADPVNSDGYGGYGGLELWDNETVGDIDSQSFKSPPFNIPAGASLSDLQARAWFCNTYSESDDDCTHSDNPDGAGADEGAITLKCAATVTIDAGLGEIFFLTLTRDVTLAFPANLRHGRPVLLCAIQDGVGGHALTLASQFKYGGELTSEVVRISGAPYARNYLGFIYNGDANALDTVAFVSGYGG